MATKKTKTQPPVAEKPEFGGNEIKVGDDAEFIAAFALGERGDVGVISVSNYKGKKALDIRRYYLSDEDEAFHPTSKGIRIPAAQVLRFLEALYDKRLQDGALS